MRNLLILIFLIGASVAYCFVSQKSEQVKGTFKEDNLQIDSVYSNSYETRIEKGIYHNKSSDQSFISDNLPIIESTILSDTSLLWDYVYEYIAIDKPIVLFKNKDPKTKNDVAGILKTSTMVKCTNVFRNHIYIDSPDAPMTYHEWFSFINKDSTYFDKYGTTITYDVWSEIEINGKKYYTDWNLHNGIEYHTYIPSKNQILCIASQSSHWDGVYDEGPSINYVVFVLDQTPQGWIQTYRSETLNLNIYDEEYSIFNLPVIVTDNKDYFELKLKDYLKIGWDGEKISCKFFNNQNSSWSAIN